ncbi:MAG: peptidylprolyl isomerase [Candidatus Omnitrophota bacterium]
MFFKRYLKILAHIMIISGLLFMSKNPAYSEIVDKVLVVVNEEVITQRDFDRMFVPIAQSYKANYEGKELERQLESVRAGLLDQLINSKVTISLAKKAEITVDEEELKRRVDKVKAYYDSEETFLQVLNSKGTNLTEFNQEVRDQMLAQKLVEQEVSAKIVITPAEIKKLYTKNKEKFVAPHKVKALGIMVRKTKDTEKDKIKITAIKTELENGKDFSELAKEKSEGPYAQEGGNMGYISQGQVLEEMEEVIFNLNEGELSDIVETHIGYHIFKVEEIQDPRILDFTEVSDYLKEQLYMKKFEENLGEWLKEKRENAYIAYK